MICILWPHNTGFNLMAPCSMILQPLGPREVGRRTYGIRLDYDPEGPGGYLGNFLYRNGDIFLV